MANTTPNFNGQKPRNANPGRQASPAGGQVKKIDKLPTKKILPPPPAKSR
jgi:hypothetical protein